MKCYIKETDKKRVTKVAAKVTNNKVTRSCHIDQM